MPHDTSAQAATIAALLQPAAVDFDTLHRRYGAQLGFVRHMIGVVPNCDPLLEIWPAGFRTYNLMIPNFLNLPFLLFGVGPPKDVVGLAGYAASRASGCAYCSAHTCTFALRRGATPEQVAEALSPSTAHTLAQRAAIVAAVALGQVPSTFDASHLTELKRHFSAADVERIVLMVAMMGFLNKFMDAAGVELEPSTVAEVEGVIAPSGWSVGKHVPAGGAPPVPAAGAPPVDSLRTTLGVLRHVPPAVRLERRWTAGVPAAWPAAGQRLREATGYGFPILGRLRSARARRALAAMLLTNLDPSLSAIGLQTKLLAGLVYATVVDDHELAEQARVLVRAAATQPDAPPGDAALLGAVMRFAAAPAGPNAERELAAAEPLAVALRLAKEASPSPAIVSAETIRRAGAALAPEQIVELLVWLSLQQLLHRLQAFDAVRTA